jgi:hypothetical protein
LQRAILYVVLQSIKSGEKNLSLVLQSESFVSWPQHFYWLRCFLLFHTAVIVLVYHSNATLRKSIFSFKVLGILFCIDLVYKWVKHICFIANNFIPYLLTGDPKNISFVPSDMCNVNPLWSYFILDMYWRIALE